MSYPSKAQKKKVRNTVINVVLVFCVLAVFKVISNWATEEDYKSCYYFKNTHIINSSGIREQWCFTHMGREKLKDIEKRRAKLYALAQKGNAHAKQKLNRLNYEEELRKQKLRK